MVARAAPAAWATSRIWIASYSPRSSSEIAAWTIRSRRSCCPAGSVAGAGTGIERESYSSIAGMTEHPRYTLISSDTHAGANHETYREFLDPKFHEDFDAWRAKYKNPWKDLRDTNLRV